MGSARSHGELDHVIGLALTWCAADPEFVHALSACPMYTLAPAGAAVGAGDADASDAVGSDTNQQEGSNLNVRVSDRDLPWETALKPLLSSPPTNNRDRRLLLAALPLVRQLASSPAMAIGDRRRRLLARVSESMLPLLCQQVVPPGNVGAGARMDGGSADCDSTTLLSLQSSTLQLIHTLLEAEAAHHADGSPQASLSLSSDGPLLHALTDLLDRDRPVIVHTTAVSLRAASSRGAGVFRPQQLALSAVAALARGSTGASAPMHWCPAFIKHAEEGGGVHPSRDVMDAWTPVIVRLFKAALEWSAVPRLPDSFLHKALVRAALDSSRGLLALARLVSPSGGAVARDLVAAGVNGGVVGLLRRLSVDREAVVRASAFGLLSEAWSYAEWWASAGTGGDTGSTVATPISSQVHVSPSWTIEEAVKTATRVSADPTEPAAVRAEALSAIGESRSDIVLLRTSQHPNQHLNTPTLQHANPPPSDGTAQASRSWARRDMGGGGGVDAARRRRPCVRRLGHDSHPRSGCGARGGGGDPIGHRGCDGGL